MDSVVRERVFYQETSCFQRGFEGEMHGFKIDFVGFSSHLFEESEEDPCVKASGLAFHGLGLLGFAFRVKGLLLKVSFGFHCQGFGVRCQL